MDNSVIDRSLMTPVGELRGGKSEVGIDLVELADEARQFLLSHKWCGRIEGLYYDRGFPKVAVFLADIEPLFSADPQVWVIVGDVPPLYIDTLDFRNGAEALVGYVLAFLDVVRLHRLGESLVDSPPVLARDSLAPIEMTDEIADLIERRLVLIIDAVHELWDEQLREEFRDLRSESFSDILEWTDYSDE